MKGVSFKSLLGCIYASVFANVISKTVLIDLTVLFTSFRLKKMGQDYSYSQPSSSSDSLDIISLLEAEAQMYADETDSSNRNAMPVQYPRQPEADDGIPTTCYCGAQPVLGCSYTPKDPYRRYFTCVHADDGDCHVWKWWEVAVMEEMREFQRQLSDLKNTAGESEQKRLNLEKTVDESEQKRLNLEKMVDELSAMKKARIKLMVCLLVLIGLVLVILRG